MYLRTCACHVFSSSSAVTMTFGSPALPGCERSGLGCLSASGCTRPCACRRCSHDSDTKCGTVTATRQAHFCLRRLRRKTSRRTSVQACEACRHTAVAMQTNKGTLLINVQVCRKQSSLHLWASWSARLPQSAPDQAAAAGRRAPRAGAASAARTLSSSPRRRDPPRRPRCHARGTSPCPCRLVLHRHNHPRQIPG